MSLVAQVCGVGVLGPGLAGWPTTAAVLRGATYQPAPTLLPDAAALPPAERRRAGRWVRLALALGTEAVSSAGAEAARLASVFSSSSADGDTCHQICETLAGAERAISPIRFHNSLHNAASGYWSIAHGSPLPTTALCAHDASFAAGLLEALTQLSAGAPEVLLVCAETDYPPPMRAVRPIPDAFGIALLLSGASRIGASATGSSAIGGGAIAISGGATRGSAHDAPRLTVHLCDEPPTPLACAALEPLRTSIPAARGLPLLESLARSRDAAVVLEYLARLRLRVEVSCP